MKGILYTLLGILLGVVIVILFGYPQFFTADGFSHALSVFIERLYAMKITEYVGWLVFVFALFAVASGSAIGFMLYALLLKQKINLLEEDIHELHTQIAELMKFKQNEI